MNEDNILNEIITEQYKNFITRMATDLMKMNYSDMVEVVRCKDCQWYSKEDGLETYICCKTVGFPTEEDYCSWGNRRYEECLNE